MRITLYVIDNVQDLNLSMAWGWRFGESNDHLIQDLTFRDSLVIKQKFLFMDGK